MGALKELLPFAGLLGMFTGILLWSVRTMLEGTKKSINSDFSNLKDGLDEELDHLQANIDKQFNKLVDEIDGHADRLKAHDEKLHDQEVAQLTLRNEMLESMRDKYVRHTDIVDIKNQISAIFDKLDKMIFTPADKGGRK